MNGQETLKQSALLKRILIALLLLNSFFNSLLSLPTMTIHHLRRQIAHGDCLNSTALGDDSMFQLQQTNLVTIGDDFLNLDWFWGQFHVTIRFDQPSNCWRCSTNLADLRWLLKKEGQMDLPQCLPNNYDGPVQCNTDGSFSKCCFKLQNISVL